MEAVVRRCGVEGNQEGEGHAAEETPETREGLLDRIGLPMSAIG